jgi:FkbM family methyltransferase
MQSSSRVTGEPKKPKLHESGIFNSRQLWNRFRLHFATWKRKIWENGMSVFTDAYLLIIGRINGRARHDGAIECSQVSGVGPIAMPCSRKTAGSVAGELIMSWTTDLIHFAGRGLRRAGLQLMDYRALKRVWLDVGACKGEHCYGFALVNPSLRVFLFEPNLRMAVKLFGMLPNFLGVPLAVTETDGSSELNINSHADASSLLPLDEQGVRQWSGAQDLRTVEKVTVGTIRLDTFLNLAGIQSVDYLKIDAQGMDLDVVRSAGNRLKDIHRICLECDVTPHPLYRGAPTKNETVEFLESRGFALIDALPQSDGQEENLTFENKTVRGA